MRLFGWCEACRRVKWVRVRWAQTFGAGMVYGLCADCEREQ